MTQDITALGVTDFSNTYAYTVQAASDASGVVKGVSFQCCPAALIYRRSIAKDVLGTDDPAEVQEKLNSWEKFNAVAAEAKAKGYLMTASEAATYRVFSNNVTSPWVDENNNLQIDSAIQTWMQQAKDFSDNGYTQDCDIWSDECTAQMFGDGKAMCYFGPAWYFNFSMGNAQDADKGCFGDWAICEGPQAHFWGGTWLLAPAGTDNPTMVADIMNTFINNEEVCTNLVKNEEQGDEHKDYVTWIQTKTYSLSAGATVKDLLEKALNETGLQETGADDGYVSSILAPEALGGYWLSEMDNGANSGWMYTVNGKHPDQALNDFTLEAGDKVIWHYVDDYTTEADAETWLKAADISPEEYAKQKLARIVQVIGGGTVEPSLGFSQLGADVTFTFEPDTNQQLLEVTVDGKSIGTPESYTYKNLTLNSRIVATFTGAMLFLDVRREDWFYSDVRYVVEHGLFHGTTQDLFSPNAPMTRGMLVTVLYRLAGSPKAAENSGFADVAAGKYYADAVAWAAESGIVSGVSDGCFAPDSRVTREQLAAILYRYARDKRYDTGRTANLTGFADYEQISGYAAEALGWANAEGLVSGRSKTALSPQGQATRAEVAAILHRFAENVAK